MVQSIVTLTLIRQGLVQDNVVVRVLTFRSLSNTRASRLWWTDVPPKKMIVVVVVGIVVVGRSTRKSVAQDP